MILPTGPLCCRSTQHENRKDPPCRRRILRIGKLLAAMDSNPESLFRVFKLKHAKAEDLAPKIVWRSSELVGFLQRV